MANNQGKKSISSKCWDCRNATNPNNVCSWSWYLKPVEGWTAKEVKKPSQYGDGTSYVVLNCPLFDRDAFDGGTKRLDDPLYQKYLEGVK